MGFKRAFVAVLIAVAVSGVVLPSRAEAGLAEAAELEAARANARAGGPLNERDRYLLERHGCLSGTNSAFCRSLEGRKPAKLKRKKPRRHD